MNKYRVEFLHNVGIYKQGQIYEGFDLVSTNFLNKCNLINILGECENDIQGIRHVQQPESKSNKRR